MVRVSELLLVKITVLAALWGANRSLAFTTPPLICWQQLARKRASTTSTTKTRNNGLLSMSTEGAEPLEQTTIARLEKGLTEMNRRDRRDFFDNDKWVEHRASDRFLGNIISIPFSSVVRMIFKEVGIISVISWLLVAYNHGLVLGYTDLSGYTYPPFTDLDFPLLTLPKEPFILSSPALSLLLVFRTNNSWLRWDEARKAWGSIVNNCRSISRKSSSWIMQSDLPQEEKEQLLRRVMDAVWSFPRAELRHLLSGYEDEVQFQLDIRKKVRDPVYASDIIRHKRHRPSFALFELSCAVNELPLDLFRRNQIDEAVSELCDAMGACDRLYSSPIPKVYSRHSSRFLFLWLAFLPLTLWEPLSVSLNHFLLPVVSSSIALAMMGIIQISIIIEEPFSVLPLKQITDGIEKSTLDHVEYNSWEYEHESRPQKQRSMTSKLYDDYLSEDYASQEYLEAMSKETVIRHKSLNQPMSTAATTTSRPAFHQPPAYMPPPPAPTAPSQPQAYYPPPQSPLSPQGYSQPSEPLSQQQYSYEKPVVEDDSNSSKLSAMERLEKMKLDVLQSIGESLRTYYDNKNNNNDDDR